MHYLRFLIQLLLTIVYIFVVFYNEKYVFFEELIAAKTSIFNSKYVFLTNLNLVFLAICLACGLMCQCLPLRSAALLQWLSGLLSSASAAMSLFVFTLFWTLYGIDRELVYPEVIDKIVPTWLNHAMHTTIVPVSLINYCMMKRQYSPSLSSVVLISMFLGLAYIAWIHVAYLMSGYWVYPILEILGTLQRAVFIAVCCLSIAPFAWAIHWVRASVDRLSYSADKLPRKEA